MMETHTCATYEQSIYIIYILGESFSPLFIYTSAQPEMTENGFNSMMEILEFSTGTLLAKIIFSLTKPLY